MIRLIAIISLLDRGNSTITSVTSNKPNNNISQPVGAVIDVKRRGSNPFLIGGASKLDGSATFASRQSIDYYIGNYGSDSNGDFASPYVIVVTGTNINHINFVFDSYNKAYPTKIKVNGVYAENDDPTFTAAHLTSNTNTITIENWSAPKFPLRIHGIFVGLEIYIDERNMIEMWSKRSDRSSNNEPAYGIISNTGFIKFLDFDMDIQDYIRQKLLKSDLSVKMYVENTWFRDKFNQTGLPQDHSKMQLVADLVTDKWDYNNLNFEVSVDCKDGLEEWQEILVPPIRLQEYKTGLDLFNAIKEYIPSKFILEDLDEVTRLRLISIKIRYYFLDSGTLWAALDKLCQLALLHIYENHQGKIVVSYSEGN